MIEPEQGFAIDDVDYRWGTTPGGISGVGRLSPSNRYLHHDMPCRTALGFAAAGMTISASAPDRPVMSASCEMAAPRLWRDETALWMDPLRARFGRPHTEGQQRDRRDSSSVTYWARWRRPTVEFGLSIYGGVRSSAFGRSAGLLYITWDDTTVAAAPFVPEWRAATAALAQSAATVAAFRRFDMPKALMPAGDSISPHKVSFEDWRALNGRNLLATPPSIGKHLSRKSVGLWQSGVGGRWSLSTLWDSIVLADTSAVLWMEVEPAKGGGYSSLSVDRWSATMPYGTSGIAAAAAALMALPGIKVEKGEDYDA